MENTNRKFEEIKRRYLTHKLIELGACNKNEKRLSKMSLKELEYEYGNIRKRTHPHSDMSSLHWINKKVSG